MKLLDTCHGSFAEARQAAGMSVLHSKSDEDFDFWARVKEILDQLEETE